MCSLYLWSLDFILDAQTETLTLKKSPDSFVFLIGEAAPSQLHSSLQNEYEYYVWSWKKGSIFAENQSKRITSIVMLGFLNENKISSIHFNIENYKILSNIYNHKSVWSHDYIIKNIPYSGSSNVLKKLDSEGLIGLVWAFRTSYLVTNRINFETLTYYSTQIDLVVNHALESIDVRINLTDF